MLFLRGATDRRPLGAVTPAAMLLELARTYLNIPAPEHQKAIVALARALAEGENGDERAA